MEVRGVVGAVPSIGGTELLVVGGVIVLLFGARKIPELARSLGQALGELRHSANDEDAPPQETK